LVTDHSIRTKDFVVLVLGERRETDRLSFVFMGLKVVERVSLVPPQTDAAGSYLRTKRDRIGHLLEVV
jgi:GTP cyclohydrolase II